MGNYDITLFRIQSDYSDATCKIQDKMLNGLSDIVSLIEFYKYNAYHAWF